MSTTCTRLMAAFALVTLAACADGTGPRPGGSDPAAARRGIAAIHTAANARIVTAIGVVRTGAGMSVVGRGGVPVTAEERLAQATAAFATQAIPIMQAGVLGKTFIYDAAQRLWRIDPARSGAPANGARIILYEVDAAGSPNASRPIGHADLVDEGRGSAAGYEVRFVVVEGTATRLDYLVGVTGAPGAHTVKVNGIWIDGGERLEFDITVGPVTGGRQKVAASLALPAESFRTTLRLDAVQGSEDGTFDLEIRSRSDILSVKATTARGTVDATVTANGELFATVKGPEDTPTIRGLGGRELVREELEFLGEVVEVAEQVFDLVSELAAPAGQVLGFAVGLR